MPHPHGFTTDFSQTFKEEVIPIIYSAFQKKDVEELFSNSFWGQYYPNTKIRQRHYSKTTDQVSFVNADVKIQKRVLASQNF